MPTGPGGETQPVAEDGARCSGAGNRNPSARRLRPNHRRGHRCHESPQPVREAAPDPLSVPLRQAVTATIFGGHPSRSCRSSGIPPPVTKVTKKRRCLSTPMPMCRGMIGHCLCGTLTRPWDRVRLRKGARLVGVLRHLPVPPWLTSCYCTVWMPVDRGTSGLRMQRLKKHRTRPRETVGFRLGPHLVRTLQQYLVPRQVVKSKKKKPVAAPQQTDSQHGLEEVLAQPEAEPCPTPAFAQQLPQTGSSAAELTAERTAADIESTSASQPLKVYRNSTVRSRWLGWKRAVMAK